MADDYPGGWFGVSWGAPVCTTERHKPTPIGEPCVECTVPFKLGDQGHLLPLAGDVLKLIPYHHDCLMRNILGPAWEGGIKDYAERMTE